MQIRFGILISIILTALAGCSANEESAQNKPVDNACKKPAQPAVPEETPVLRTQKDKDLSPDYEGRTIPRDAWSREDIAAILEQVKKLREHARKSYGASAELSLVFPLVQPGMRKDDVIAIVGEPNNTSLSDGPWYYLSEYVTRLVYRDDILIDSIKDLYRRAGSSYSEVSKTRALQRLAEIRPIKAATNFFDGWDLGIQTVRTLGTLHDPQAVPVLVEAAKKAAHWVPGSESATIHGIYQQTIVNSLARITGLPPTMKEGQNPEALRRMAEEANKWWQKQKDNIPVPNVSDWGPVAEGLQMRIHLDKDEYKLGEIPKVTAQIRNQTDKSIKICNHWTFFTRFVTDKESIAVRRKPEFVKDRPDFPVKNDVVTIKPGSPYKVELGTADQVIEGGQLPASWRVLQAPEKAGTYDIVVHYCGVDAYDDHGLGEVWIGVLTSNVQRVEFVK